ncbi:adenosylcobalamin biosynthesis bifunctional protein CobP [Ameyamaea chiangmaiensis NBRC 103196]|uniref:Bifunctional adenosylcobalamin biosynthesis protein n=1 Tax=Ameyamaea chiangmaiensis TaxID=442969 RepID=A0A850PAC3_9PROT|nr:bifunctional adenosylcobinamide kinase/adenosylcobinamide-phosphate guanylyltransferase [Ameyamaea chiangmaiensis]MBS4076247.1 bifunctional adenosylcobinamide kinase/adenosylcobinamide-phosphate guanylyltransferase [Ameyamaea chiangmaiensis]NVN41477.1 bifunctional adenosylcobinamide kinase/adenosylcobinamide-phosphate guanylyltransferase [Ameyamaea chiangmaiensis]GBQ64697.1 adenosylcobalamin biosynthesis bifunctional protein CobP [Ameyamaea chiangmaiensis NBRC 103196]
MAEITLVLGGARSGKSAYAEARTRRAPGPWRYIATAQAWDDEMRTRIDRHRAARGPGWETVETPFDVPGALADAGARPVLVDCLTLWLSNLLLGERDIASATADLLAALARRQAPTVLVGSEVGLGIVPENALARRFRDEAGLLHQSVAVVAQHVVLCIAGCPMAARGEA